MVQNVVHHPSEIQLVETKKAMANKVGGQVGGLVEMECSALVNKKGLDWAKT